MFRNGLIFRVIGAFLLLGLIVAGGFMAFKAGEAQGIIQAPAVATAISQAAENGEAVPPMYGHGYGGYGHPMMYRHHFGFFPIGFCFSILFVFFFFGVMRMIFFRPWHHHGGHHGSWRGPWGKHWENGVPPKFDEWHKRAHGEKVEDEEESKKE